MKKILLTVLLSLLLVGCSLNSSSFKVKLNNKDVKVKVDYTDTNGEYLLNFNINDKKIGEDFIDQDAEELVKSIDKKVIKGYDKEYLVLILTTNKYTQQHIYIMSEDKLIARLEGQMGTSMRMYSYGEQRYIPNEQDKVDKFYVIEDDKIYYLCLGNVQKSTLTFEEYIMTFDDNQAIITKSSNTYIGTEIEGESIHKMGNVILY